VFFHPRQDGSIQMEVKVTKDIFSDLKIQSAKSKPLTDDHPNEPVTLQNYSLYLTELKKAAY
jgi:hypothetical protein